MLIQGVVCQCKKISKDNITITGKFIEIITSHLTLKINRIKHNQWDLDLQDASKLYWLIFIVTLT